MYELYIDQELVFPDGSSMKSDELSDTPYAILKKVPCVIDVSKGITMAFSPLGPLAETFGIDVSQDDETIVSELNAIRSAEYANSKLKAMTYSSVVSAAKLFAVSLPDEQAIEVADLYPEYEVDHAYKQNDRFQYNGSLYKVNQDHTSQAQWVPGETGTESLYTNLMLDESGYQIWKQPTGAHDAYNTGDIVRYPDKDGQLYKSTINGNVWAPDVYPQGWEVYTEE